jgi:hypothetical protein
MCTHQSETSAADQSASFGFSLIQSGSGGDGSSPAGEVGPGCSCASNAASFPFMTPPGGGAGEVSGSMPKFRLSTAK